MSDWKEYSNGEITIVWKQPLCIHSTNCWRGLLSVFNPKDRPWIKPEAASSERIIEQIAKCPSGALTYFANEEQPAQAPAAPGAQVVEVLQNGPLLVHGNITVKDKDGTETAKNNVTAFCRCGHSANKPYCDGSHGPAGFAG